MTLAYDFARHAVRGSALLRTMLSESSIDIFPTDYILIRFDFCNCVIFIAAH